MNTLDTQKTQDSLQGSLQQVLALLHRHRLVENLVHKQDMPKHTLVESLVHKQNLRALQKKLDQLHTADVAYILESLPLEDRLVVWELVKAERDGDILLEVSDAVRESLIEVMDTHELVAAAEQLDADELADLAPDLPQQVVYEVMDGLDSKEREQLQSALSYTEDQVGSLMDFELVKIRADVTLEVVLRYLRRFEELPDQTDKIFVVDEDNRVQGVLPLKTLLVSDPDALVEVVMARDVVVFHPEDDSGDAAQAFERYDLITAPVVNADNQLIGRLTVDEMVDVIREESDSEVLSMAGLKEEEDLFASV